MKIAFGSDHAGYEYRQMLMAHARELGHEVIDYGTFSKESCDYPVYGHAVGAAVALAGHPWLSIPAAMAAGVTSGFVTALLQTKMGVDSLLAAVKKLVSIGR